MNWELIVAIALGFWLGETLHRVTWLVFGFLSLKRRAKRYAQHTDIAQELSRAFAERYEVDDGRPDPAE